MSSGHCCGDTESTGGWLRLSGCSNLVHSSPTGQSSPSMFNPGQGYPAVSCPRSFLLSEAILYISCCFFDTRVRERRAFNYTAVLVFRPLKRLFFRTTKMISDKVSMRGEKMVCWLSIARSRWWWWWFRIKFSYFISSFNLYPFLFLILDPVQILIWKEPGLLVEFMEISDYSQMTGLHADFTNFWKWQNA